MDEPAGLVETHSAVVVFLGEHAYKAKKHVDLGFLDFRTREAREAVCHREVELNRRLAPDVYLGVADVIGPSGELCDHLVLMRRMPSDRRLSTLVTSGADVGPDLRRVARLLAEFHKHADRSPAINEAARARRLAQRWTENTDTLRSYAGRFIAAADVEAVQDLAAAFLDGREQIFDERIAAGRACDGHGDLLADDIFCLDDGPRVLDCLEFDNEMRYGDVLADVAFLTMDLERLGRLDLAVEFLDAYSNDAGDVWPSSLAHHLIAYRAQVRAKVSAIRAGQGDEPSAAAAGALLQLARRHLEAAQVRLVLLGGLPGTGKSTIAAEVGASIGAIVLRSDEVRKELAGLEPTTAAAATYGEGIYTQEATTATYAELLRQAGIALGRGETVILDASWTDGGQRDAARATAKVRNAELIELVCVAPAPVASARLRSRSAAGGDSSDAEPVIAEAMARDSTPWPTATVIDNSGDLEPAIRQSLDRITAWRMPTPG